MNGSGAKAANGDGNASLESSPLVTDARQQSWGSTRSTDPVLPKTVEVTPKSSKAFISMPTSPGSPISWPSLLHQNWPVLKEFLGTYLVVLGGLTSRSSSDWTMGLLFAGFCHVAAVGTGSFYLQANPIITIGQAIRRQITLVQAAMFLGANLVATLLALATVAAMVGKGMGPAVLLSLMNSGGLSYGSALLVVFVYSTIWVYVTLSARDAMALSLEPWCTFYGIASGGAFAAATACVASREMGTGLLNPWIGLFGLITEAATTGVMRSPSCAGVFVVGPVLGAGAGALLSWLTSFDGSEKEEFLRNMAPVSAPLMEAVGLAFLILTFGTGLGAVPTGALYLALTFCAWRKSGAQFNPAITLVIFLLKRDMFKWTGLMTYLSAHILGGVVGSMLLIAMPIPAAMPLTVNQAVTLTGASALSSLIFGVAYLAIFVANTECEFDIEGFQHPVLMASLAFLGLQRAVALDPIATGLFNPVCTSVLWAALGASPVSWIVMTLLQVFASLLAFSMFYLRSMLASELP